MVECFGPCVFALSAEEAGDVQGGRELGVAPGGQPQEPDTLCEC